MKKIALTIAGSDSGGGAGIQADLKTFEAFNCFGVSVITALTAQNLSQVEDIHFPPIDFFRKQLKTVLNNFDVRAIKIGMVGKVEILEVICESLSNFSQLKSVTVIDPVMVATSGGLLSTIEMKDAYLHYAPKIAGLITPNLIEALTLLNQTLNNSLITNQSYDYQDLIRELSEKFSQTAILLKGGHLLNMSHEDDNFVSDYFISQQEDKDLKILTCETIKKDFQFHGTGCTLSSAISAGLANGLELLEAIIQARNYVQKCIIHSPENIFSKSPIQGMIRVLNHNSINNN